jgi:hypothetical protein
MLSQFISITVVSATIFFKSLCDKSRKKASSIARDASTSTSDNAAGDASVFKIRHIASTPNFTIKPLSRIENSVEASTCAFSSQDTNGQEGTLTPKPTTRNRAISEEEGVLKAGIPALPKDKSSPFSK